MSVFCLVSERQVESGRLEHPAPAAGHDGEFISSVRSEKLKVPRYRIPSAPLVPADLAVIFCVAGL